LSDLRSLPRGVGVLQHLLRGLGLGLGVLQRLLLLASGRAHATPSNLRPSNLKPQVAQSHSPRTCVSDVHWPMPIKSPIPEPLASPLMLPPALRIRAFSRANSREPEAQTRVCVLVFWNRPRRREPQPQTPNPRPRTLQYLRVARFSTIFFWSWLCWTYLVKAVSHSFISSCVIPEKATSV
jgi:hypothetical protein